MPGIQSSSSGTLEKMTITAYEKQDFTGKKGEFKALVNPSSISHSHNITLKSNEEVANTSETTSNYVSTAPEKLSFELIFDGTGVLAPDKTSKEDLDVLKQIEKFKECTYVYDGENHEPPYVIIQWGMMFFGGRMDSLEITHSLFSSGGNPLRSKAKASFVSTIDPKEAAKAAGKSSPDLSHIRTTREGDTLPLMCEKIYGDSSYYLEVARINNLVNFRKLQPGLDIIFPPLR